jgi:hypothetical protein
MAAIISILSSRSLAANAGRVPRNAPNFASPDVGPELVVSSPGVYRN